MNGAGGCGEVLLGHFVVTACDGVDVHKGWCVENFLQGLFRASLAAHRVRVFDVFVGPVVNDLCDFFAHVTIFSKHNESPGLCSSVIGSPCCGFDH